MDDGENWECAGCGEDDGEATDYVGCDRCGRWFHFACAQLANKAADFACNFSRCFYILNLLMSIPDNICLVKFNYRNFRTSCEN